MRLAQERSSLRTLILVGSAALAMLGASGLLQAEIFHQPTTLKYVLTIGGPLVVFATAIVERPLQLLAALVVIAAPFADATAQFMGTRVSPLVPLLFGGFALAVISDVPRGRPPALRWTALLAFPLLLLPLRDGSGNHEFVVSVALMVCVGWFVSYAAAETDGLRTVLVAVSAQVAVQGAIAIWEWHTGHTLNLYSTAGTTEYGKDDIYAIGSSFRPTGSLPDPISLGNVLAISIPLISVLLLTSKSWVTRGMHVAALALVGAALGLSLDRASWVGASAGVVLLIALLPRGARRRAIPYVGLGAVLVVGAALLLAGSQVTSRFDSIFDPTSTAGKTAAEVGLAKGEQNRFQLWRVALKDGFLDHPVAGIGIGEIGPLELAHTTTAGAGVKAGTANYQNAASTYLQLLGEGGLFALALLVLLISALFADVHRGLRTYPLIGAALAGSVAAVLTCWVADVVVFYEPVAACVGVLFGAVAGGARSSGAQSAPT